MARGKDVHQARQADLNIAGKVVAKRCKSKCELCGINDSLKLFEVTPIDKHEVNPERCIMVCHTCYDQIHAKASQALDTHHWMCLHESVWSEYAVVQVVAWRMLQRLSDQAWARDLIEQMYMDEDTLAWAQDGAKK